MPATVIRRVLVGAALLVSLGLAACGDDETTQRKAFLEFLQTRIVEKPGVHVPKPSEEETKAFGDYAKHYAVILSFNEGLDKNVSARVQQVFQHGMVRSLDELTTRRADIATVIEGMRALRAALDAELAKADAAHAALKQPDELKAVYNKAYEKTVTSPATAFKDAFPAMDAAFQATQNLANFLDRHRDAIKINGGSVQTSDAKLTTELNGLINALNQNGQAVLEAQRKLQAVIQGS
jgi:hypothetical protein